MTNTSETKSFAYVKAVCGHNKLPGQESFKLDYNGQPVLYLGTDTFRFFSISSFPGCCGFRILQGFPYNKDLVKSIDSAEYIFKTLLKLVRKKTPYTLVITLNSHQSILAQWLKDLEWEYTEHAQNSNYENGDSICMFYNLWKTDKWKVMGWDNSDIEEFNNREKHKKEMIERRKVLTARIEYV